MGLILPEPPALFQLLFRPFILHRFILYNDQPCPHAFILLASSFSLGACTQSSAETDLTPKSTDLRISKDTVLKQICLNGVSYYATVITDSINSFSGHTYLVVGGPVFASGSPVPVSCVK